MALNLTDTERRRLAAANIDALFDFAIASLDRPELLDTVTPGQVLVLPTNDAWVNKLNLQLAQNV